MNFIRPKDDNNFLIVCERCKAIVNFSKEDCYCIKEADEVAFKNGEFKNVTRAYISCPSCRNMQDVIGGLKYTLNDKTWW